ncbi:sodium/proline symporter PutP [Methanosarcina sp. KYL-1]|uniref:sodium/proline symporter PutP n=1 Tax=Methanosarcina sp. KYL-1 TaxID=2602068 RepID=UPI002101321C|nr:sodium/proline symporter PutP [Methanosarcina sp. KYL-1]MCQ1536782.1 sodium/proline symporter PutP [Methanosarcina sp. KYL-1]
MVSDNFSIILVFAVYLLFMISIGVIYYRRTENLADYILGGRKLNSWVTALSSQASDMSGWLLLGLPGYAYLAGMESIWIGIGLAVGTYLNWKFVAKKLRQYTYIAGDAITIPVYFENRFRDKSHALRIISAILILVFFLLYTSSGLVAGGKLFNTVFEVPYQQALLIGALVIISYTFLGGFMAVCWTDFFQGMLMVCAIVLVPVAAMKGIGGYGSTIDIINNIDPQLLNPWTALAGGAIPLISNLAWGFGYFGMPHILVRFMAIESADKIKQARLIAMVWVVISLLFAVVVGLVGRAYLYPEFLGDTGSETIFMVMVNNMFPPILAGLLLAAILAAIMSTADSQLLVAASAFTEDIYRIVMKKDASEKELVWLGRLAVIAISAIAYMIARDPNNSVMGLVSYAWAGFGAAFGPIILFSLFWRRTTRNAALGGMISGGLMVILWKNLSGGIFDLYEIVPGFVLSCIVIYIVSILDKEGPSEEILKEFDRVNHVVLTGATITHEDIQPVEL